MEAKQVKNLMEAYASVYTQPEEVIAESDCECEDEKSEKETPEMNGKKKGKKEDEMKEGYDLFDYLLEYLVAEGYADTNKAALAIMANMSEEWKQSIVEQKKDDLEAPDYKDAKRIMNQSGGGRRTGAQNTESKPGYDPITGIRLKGV